MKEVKTEIKTYVVRAYCDCGGEFIPEDGVIYSDDPISYRHRCNGCDKVSNLDYSYPRNTVEEVTQ